MMAHRQGWLAWLVFASGLVAPSLGRAAPNDWAEGTPGLDDGATRDYYNRGVLLPWRQLLGDWVDVNGLLHGDAAWVATQVDDTDTARWIEWDVTDLVQAWIDQGLPNQGFFLRAISGSGPLDFRSREAPESNERPELLIDVGGRTSVTATCPSIRS